MQLFYKMGHFLILEIRNTINLKLQIYNCPIWKLGFIEELLR